LICRRSIALNSFDFDSSGADDALPLETLGLDEDTFLRTMSSPRLAEHLATDRALVERLGIRGAPTLFVAGQRLDGAQSRETIERLIDDALAHAN
jgi:predicted DsbA family dithiol-disulfide isomerase